MNEHAIKALSALARRIKDFDLWDSVTRAIEDLEAEDSKEEARQLTLCQSNGISLTVCPPLYQCKWCNKTWYCHAEPPVCSVRVEAEAKGEKPQYSFGGWGTFYGDNTILCDGDLTFSATGVGTTTAAANSITGTSGIG